MKNSSENKSFAVFIILSFLVYIMSNGEWCIPIFAWIYPILFLCMIYLNRTRIVYLIVCSIYAIGFVVQFGRAIGMDIKICIMVSIEYIIYLVYPILGGLSDAYTQYQNLYLLQIVTVTGIYGITFLIYSSLFSAS